MNVKQTVGVALLVAGAAMYAAWSNPNVSDFQYTGLCLFIAGAGLMLWGTKENGTRKQD